MIWEKEFYVDVKFGDLTVDRLNSIFKDGRASSIPMSYLIANLFELEFVDKKGYDYITKDFPFLKIEKKQLTKGGCNFGRSGSYGKGRKLDREKEIEHIKTIPYYLICDIRKFPYVKARIIENEILINKFPNLKIPGNFKNIDDIK